MGFLKLVFITLSLLLPMAMPFPEINSQQRNPEGRIYNTAMSYNKGQLLSGISLNRAYASPTSSHELKTYKDFSNKALEYFENSQFGEARIQIERALFLNPFSSKSFTLRRRIMDKLSETSYEVHTESIPAFYYYIDFIPDFILVFFFLLALGFFVFNFTKLIYSERSQYKRLPPLRVYSILTLLPLLFTGGLVMLKYYSNSSSYACLKTDASIYSGPDTEYSLINSLPAGSCVYVERTENSWASIYSKQKGSGWTPRSSLGTVRGDEFDLNKVND